ncbi:MAG: dual specificity protein phosphatase [Chloroflexota bacterium]
MSVDLHWIQRGFAVGSRPTARQRSAIAALGIQAVVTLCEADPREREDWHGLGVTQVHVPTPDWSPIPPRCFDAATEALERCLDQGTPVLLHCFAGVNRAPTLAAATLVIRRGVSVAEAISAVRAARRQSDPTPEQIASLHAWLAGRRHHLR